MERRGYREVVSAAVRAVNDVDRAMHGVSGDRRYPIVSIAEIGAHTEDLAEKVREGIAVLRAHGQLRSESYVTPPLTMDDGANRTVQLSGVLPNSEPPVGDFSFQTHTSVFLEGQGRRFTNVSIRGKIESDGAVTLNPDSIALQSDGATDVNGIAKVPRHGQNIQDLVTFARAALPQQK